ncbi:hypothetical protein KFL_000520210 [Klebsormidium nitens]|uniref:NFACT RNA-binding domain-containing protein n=1 Tax=Klebsormidium nitens TaxID=105231 RepID=A0A1Y1HTL8_KLENI|nr:hypothetical protein KFL_000520210 [Klebsormidium nitens]|eukprot:GAQ80351.1 hypothetical protein KFL_000520210 [Klebsormidium nitens]
MKHGLKHLRSVSSICNGLQPLRATGHQHFQRDLHSSTLRNGGDDGSHKGVIRGSSLQPVDYTTLAASCFELETEWLPSKVERITQTDKHTVAIGLRTLEQNGWLYLCWHPVAARLCTGGAPPVSPSADGFSFGEQLRQTLRGLALLEVGLPEKWERVARLRFGVRPGDPPVKDLYVEVMGRYSNVVLTSPQGEVIACAYQVGSKMSSLRTLQTGSQYVLPPPASGLSPTDVQTLDDWADVLVRVDQPTASKSLVRAFRGVSPTLAAELVSKAGVDPNKPFCDLTSEDRSRFFDAWKDWLERLEGRRFRPGIDSATGKYTVLADDPAPEPVQNGTHHGQAVNAPSGEGIHTMLDEYYSTLYSGDAFGALKQQLTSKVRAALKRLQGKAKVYQDQLASADGAADVVRKADLLMAYLHECPPRASEVTLNDFETGEPVVIALDPDKPALAVAQKMYKRSSKLRRSRAAVEPLLEEALEELRYLQEVDLSLQELESFQREDDLRVLEEVRDELIEAGYVKPVPTGGPVSGKGKRKKSRAPGSADLTANMRKLSSPSGFVVLVGRNSRQNDTLTHRVATQYDLWFHAQGVPGSHVLLRVPPGQSAGQDDIGFAAGVAAYYSKMKGNHRAPVIYVAPKHIGRPRGARPGLVTVENETVVTGDGSTEPQGVEQPVPV